MKQIKYLILSLIILVLSTFNMTQAKPYSAAEVQCIQTMLHHEARAEPIQGRVAVIQVVLNRMKDSRFPDTACGVIHQKGQFSWVGKGYTIQEKSLYESNKAVVRDVLAGKYKDPTGGAIFFNSNHRSPTKTAKLTVRIGGHSFYK